MISRRTFLLQSAGAVAAVSALGGLPGAATEPQAAAPKSTPPVPPPSAVYTRSLASQHGFEFNGMLLKMTYHF